jgi:hypothetical protein
LPSQIYEHNGFVIFPCGDSYIVYNTAKQFSKGHSHLRGFKPCKDAIFFVTYRKIPKRTNFYYLRTLQRLSVDEKYIQDIEGLIKTRKNKGKKQRYKNVPIYVR